MTSVFHDHAVVSDGAFALEGGRLRFYPAPEPSAEELAELVERLRRRIFEVDPVLCEACGGEMKLVAVII